MFEDGSWLQPIRELGDAAITQYFSSMSEAMAMSCSGTVYVMTDNPLDLPNFGSIWGTKEYPIIKQRWLAGTITNLVCVSAQDTSHMWNINIADLSIISSASRREVDEHLARLEAENPHWLESRDDCTANIADQPDGSDFFG